MPKKLPIEKLTATGVIEDLKASFKGDVIPTAAIVLVQAIDKNGDERMVCYWDDQSSLAANVGMVTMLSESIRTCYSEVDIDDDDEDT